MKILEQTKVKVLVAILFVLGLTVTLSQQYWCQFLHLFGVDFCWFVSADPIELERGFPRYFMLVYLLNFALDYGLLILMLVVVMVVNAKAIRQNILLLLFSTLFALVLGEFGLRILGYQPGQFNYSQWVQPVDSLYALQGFTTDENGVFKVDTAFVQRVMADPDKYGPTHKPFPQDWNYSSELGSVFQDHKIVPNETDNGSTEFWNYVETIQADGPKSELDKLILEYAQSPFNADGFYSLPFDLTSNPSDGFRILLLGDSFTWGHSSTNKTRSFSNILLTRGYEIYNTGISGSDPIQYKLILEYVAAKVKPDLIICNFFIGNDVLFFERPTIPYLPIHYNSNAGNLIPFQNGVMLESMEAAYNNIIGNMAIPQDENKVWSSSIIGTYAWFMLVQLGVIDYEFFTGMPYPEKPYTEKEMDEIANMCDTLGANFILSVIPKLEKGKLVGAESIPGLFGDVPYHQPNVTADMYNQMDGHFNDEGHLVYANYLEKLIKAELEKGSLKR